MGVILWEIARRVITGKYMIPYSEYKLKLEFQILYQVAEKGIRPTMPDGDSIHSFSTMFFFLKHLVFQNSVPQELEKFSQSMLTERS